MRARGRLVTVAMVAAAICASSAAAKPRLREVEAVAPSTFWSELVAPNADEVAMLVRKTRELFRTIADADEEDFAWAVEAREQLLVDVYHLMKYARGKSPRDLDVLALFGEAADELGKPAEAIEALTAAIAITGPDKASPATTARLGAIYLRRGEFDQAIRWLRIAEAAGIEGGAIVQLAHALSGRGEHASAIEALVGALPDPRLGYSGDGAIVAFALAVHYDRDGQAGAAFDVLEPLARALQTSLATTIDRELFELRLSAADTIYYRALLYEAVGRYVEARAEWGHYAAFPGVPHRLRALDHLARIDEQRRAAPGPRPPIQGMPPQVIRRKLPRVP